jgi:hypothetical protein
LDPRDPAKKEASRANWFSTIIENNVLNGETIRLNGAIRMALK